MLAVVQRVSQARVEVAGEVVGRVAAGLCVLVGVAAGDTAEDARRLAQKVTALRIFDDPAGRMNLSVVDVGGGLLAVSQFTLLGDVRNGNRPSFTAAMEPVEASALFDRFCDFAREAGVPVETGRFQTTMRVELVNEGPVTILVDSRKRF